MVKLEHTLRVDGTGVVGHADGAAVHELAAQRRAHAELLRVLHHRRHELVVDALLA